MKNRISLVLFGSLLLAGVTLLLAGVPTVSMEPSAHSRAYDFTSVHIENAPQIDPYVIDETQIYSWPSSTAPAERPRVSVPSVKATVEYRGKVLAKAGSTRAGIGNDRAVSGKASWYCSPQKPICHHAYPPGSMVAAACGKLRRAMGPSWRGQTVTVSTGSKQVTVKLVDWCGSKDKLIDLYREPMRLLDGSGVLGVTVYW